MDLPRLGSASGGGSVSGGAEVLRRLDNLELSQVFVEYVWIGGQGTDLHSRTRVLSAPPTSLAEVPPTTIDGRACGLATAERGSDVTLQPCCVFKDPFRRCGSNFVVLCETLLPRTVDHETMTVVPAEPHPSCNRGPCERALSSALAHAPWFTIEQEYTLFAADGDWPLGWPRGLPSRDAHTGFSESCRGRAVADAHARACLWAGVRVTRYQPGSLPGIFSYSIGPCTGIEAADHHWMSRYIMMRVTEEAGLRCSWDPKPAPGDWSGTGCTVKYSTKGSRALGTGWADLEQHAVRLAQNHHQLMMVYGASNERRVGELSQSETCSWGVGDRSHPVYIPESALADRGGYIVDQRPAASMDPYLVTMMVTCTTLAMQLPVLRAPRTVARGRLHSTGTMPGAATARAGARQVGGSLTGQGGGGAIQETYRTSSPGRGSQYEGSPLGYAPFAFVGRPSVCEYGIPPPGSGLGQFPLPKPTNPESCGSMSDDSPDSIADMISNDEDDDDDDDGDDDAAAEGGTAEHHAVPDRQHHAVIDRQQLTRHFSLELAHDARLKAGLQRAADGAEQA
ncbi:unnamed protein product [Pedinophyceae sp. YPF-701]|nr:unnamed protein product [Pedinophyceae sp. YPF-701]